MTRFEPRRICHSGPKGKIPETPNGFAGIIENFYIVSFKSRRATTRQQQQPMPAPVPPCGFGAQIG
jgi:hypothetical protein